jgi:hypothetical protein
MCILFVGYLVDRWIFACWGNLKIVLSFTILTKLWKVLGSSWVSKLLCYCIANLQIKRVIKLLLKFQLCKVTKLVIQLVQISTNYFSKESKSYLNFNVKYAWPKLQIFHKLSFSATQIFNAVKMKMSKNSPPLLDTSPLTTKKWIIWDYFQTISFTY